MIKKYYFCNIPILLAFLLPHSSYSQINSDPPSAEEVLRVVNEELTFSSMEEFNNFIENKEFKIEIRSNGQIIDEERIRLIDGRFTGRKFDPSIFSNNGNQIQEHPGQIRLSGLKAPVSEAIRVMFGSRSGIITSNLDREDGELFLIAKNKMYTNDFMTAENLDFCRYLLNPNKSYDPNNLADQIANELIGIDQSEREYIEDVYDKLIASLSPAGAELVKDELHTVHAHIRFITEDYMYTSQHDPQNLIKRRVTFCQHYGEVD